MPNQRSLPNVALVGVDTVNTARTLRIIEHCRKFFIFGDVHFFSNMVLDTEPKNGLGIQCHNVDGIHSVSEYCGFIVRNLANYISKPHVFIVQHDSCIMNPNAWTDEFLKYDYISPPWPASHMRSCGFTQFSTDTVGMDGISIRSLALMKFMQKFPSHNEQADNFYCITHRQEAIDAGFKYAPLDLAFRFAVDTQTYTNSFAIHGHYHRKEIEAKLAEVI